MANLQELVRSPNVEQAASLYERYMYSELWVKYPQWQQHMDAYWERRQLWCMAWRDPSMMGHNTNNFSEATIRLFKDIVLGRCKAYNVVTLVDFTCTVMEDYYRSRLRNFSQARVHKPRLMLNSLLQKSAYLDRDSIVTVDEDTFFVPSSSATKNDDQSDHDSADPVHYVVNHKLGTCTCIAAAIGRFCKHQAGVWKLMGTPMPSLPPVSAEVRHQMAVLALGDKAAPPEFYSDFTEPSPSQSAHQASVEDSLPQTSAHVCGDTDKLASVSDTDNSDDSTSPDPFDTVLDKL